MSGLLVVAFAAAVVGVDDREGRSGIEQRTPWTTSRIAGSPEPPPPYRVELAFPKLSFSRPTVLTNAPGIDRLFVTEQDGKIFSFPNDKDSEHSDLVIELKLARPKLEAIYGLAFHPQFPAKRDVFVCYVVNIEDKEQATRVSRFQTTDSDPVQLDPQTEEILITWLSGGHNGGCLQFGPDGYLYISTGDAGPASPPDPKRVGQDVTNLLSSILRIDIDQSDAPQPYRVPDDNPFVDRADARAEIWSFGFRNPWKFSFDRMTGDLWVGDVGWELWEMIYRVERGGNYGWSIREGRQSVHLEETIGPTPILPPTLDHPHSEAASITGGYVYRGQRISELTGAYIYGDFQTGIVWGARFEGENLIWKKELARTPLQLVGFGEDNHGELFLLDHRQQIYRLVENPQPDRSASFPRKLSETGLFESVEDQQPAAGVIPYSINAQPWADNARAERWIAVPDSHSIEIGRRGYWQFPDGSVVAKTISMPIERGATRLETQILHREEGTWRPYSYIWNDSQTDALLNDEAGMTRALRVPAPELPGGYREQTYQFATRTECILCHNPWVEMKTTVFGVQSASPLALDARQINREHQYGDVTANQLSTFAHIGLLADDGLDADEKLAGFADPYDPSADLNARARAYFHVNCAHCHQFNAGGSATIELSYPVKLSEAKIVGVRPSQGAFGITDASIVSAGDPLGSVLLYRMAKLGGGRMPRAGSHEVDEEAVQLIYDWIAAMEPVGSAAHGIDESLVKLRVNSEGDGNQGVIEQLTSSTRGALGLLRLVDAGQVQTSVRDQIVASGVQHSSAEVRDLFERFVPTADRVQKLGTSVDAAELLGLPADAERGRRVFFESSAAACKNCHKIAGVGETLGPDLSEIGKKYSRAQLLTHVLEPSKFMEPEYVPYLLETSNGQLLTGLVESKTDQEVALRDAQRKLHQVAAEDVELLVRQQKSIMPELLLRDLTRNEVADLLAYLSSLK